MRKIFFILFCAFVFNSCASLKSVEEKQPAESDVLGTVSVSTLGFTWQKFERGNRKTEKLIQRLEEKALKKYGPNIRLINADVGRTHPAITPAMWAGAGVVGLGSALIASTQFSDGNGNPTNQNGYNTCLGVTLGTGLIFFFKGFQAKALVVKSDTPYVRGSLEVFTEDEIKQKEADRIAAERKAREEKLAAEKEAEELKQAEIRFQENKIRGETKQKLIDRAKKYNSPLAFTSYYIYDINSADGVSVGLNYINTSGKTLKYIYLDLLPYNRVNDSLPWATKTIRATEFVPPSNDIVYNRWECVWYDSTLAYFDIVKIKVVFDDDSEVVIDDKNILNEIKFTLEESKLYSNPLNLNRELWFKQNTPN